MLTVTYLTFLFNLTILLYSHEHKFLVFTIITNTFVPFNTNIFKCQCLQQINTFLAQFNITIYQEPIDDKEYCCPVPHRLVNVTVGRRLSQ